MSFTLLSTRLSRGVTGVAVASAGAGLYYTYMRNVVHADSGAPKRAFGSGPAFLSLELESAEAVNHNTKRLRFKLPEPDTVSGLTLTYEPGVLEFLVKRYPNGKQSTHIHSLKPGDSLRFVTRLPGYNWKPNNHSEIMLIAGGAGITPAYQLIRGILQNPDDQTKITLVFGVNTDADLLLKKEFDDYKTRFPSRFQAVYTVSHPTDDSPFRKGYVSKDLLREVGPRSEDCKVFVCGPPPMEESLVGGKRKSGILEELGYRKDQIHKF
ncbi:hypothetical protein ABKA04_008274 [Annulohypoxylon sp. FPYF3050]